MSLSKTVKDMDALQVALKERPTDRTLLILKVKLRDSVGSLYTDSISTEDARYYATIIRECGFHILKNQTIPDPETPTSKVRIFVFEKIGYRTPMITACPIFTTKLLE